MVLLPVTVSAQGTGAAAPVFGAGAAGPVFGAGAPQRPTIRNQPAVPAAGAPRGEREPADRAEQRGQVGAPTTTDINQRDEFRRDEFQRNEFQDFVTQSVGRTLPLFGYDLFTGVPATFAPVDRVPVTPDYVIGPGDEILLRGWGQVDIDYRAVVDRNGAINIPTVGTFNVAGLRYQNLESHLKTSLGRMFRNFELNVTLGALRSIQVFVVGNARRPGSYTVSSLSTLVNALFASGGPSVSGSMRRIQLKRSDKVVTEFDLYDLLLKGDKSKDVALLSGDVIYIPPIGQLAAISGSVNVPAIYETIGKTTLGDFIAIAGGLTVTAAGQKVLVERIFERKVRKVDEFALDQGGLARELRNGDLIRVIELPAKFDNAVTLRGNVAQPARFPWREGMRVKDLIPRVEALLSRQYWLRKNQTVGLDNTIAELLRRNQAAGVDIPVADLLKKNLQSPQEEADATVAESMRRSQIAADVATARADLFRRTVPPVQAGATVRPGSTGLGIGQGSQAGVQDKQDNIARTKLADEIKRNLNEVNWNYAVIERINPRDLSTTLVPFNLGKAILEDDPAQNILLQPGDVVTIFSVDDIQVPISKQTKYVRLEGEFANAGIYRVEPGETLRQLVARVGGLSPNAYLYGAEFTRESNRIYQQKKLEEAINRLEREIQASAISRSKNVTTAEEAAGLAQDAQAQQTLIGKLRQVKATGRIVLDLPMDDATGLKDLPDIALEDSDRFIVPSRPSTINVVGAVYNENAFVFRPEKRLTDYLRQAGGVSRTGDKDDVYLLRVDGSVISKRQSGWLTGSLEGERLMPGDTIVVPEDFDRTTWTKVLKDYGTILYQFGLGAAALKVIQQ